MTTEGRFFLLFFAAAAVTGTVGVVALRLWQQVTGRSKQTPSNFERVAESDSDSDREALKGLMEVVDRMNRDLDPDYVSKARR